MKKIISVITALSLACTGFISYRTSFPDETAVQAVAVSEGKVRIHVSEELSATNGMFTVTYNPEKIKIDENVVLNKALSGTMNVVNTQTAGKIVICFASAKAVTISEYIAELSFTSLTGEAADTSDLFTLNVDELITLDADGTEKDVPAKNIGISLAEPAPEFIFGLKDQTDDNIEISFDISENPGITNGVFTMKYDTSLLEFESGTSGSIFENAFFEINESEPGVIKIAFLSNETITNKGTAATIVFKCKKEGTAKINLTANELDNIDKDGNTLSYYVPEQSASVPVKANTVSSPAVEITASESEKNSAYISISENSGITNGIFTVKYDTSVLEFKSGTPCELFEGALCEINESEPGVIKIAFISNSPVTLNGNAVKLDFEAKKSGTAELNLTVNELADISQTGESHSFNIPDSLWTIEASADSEVSVTTPAVTSEPPVSETTADTTTEPSVTTVPPVTEQPDITTSMPAGTTTAYIVSDPMECDINDDEVVTTADLIKIMQVILSQIPASECPSADINKDGYVNILDFIAVRKIFLG